MHLKFSFKNIVKFKLLSIISFSCILVFLAVSYYLQEQLVTNYEKLRSSIIIDRNDQQVFVKPNDKGYLTKYLSQIPPQFKKLLIKKEDKFFYYHFGANPWSIFQKSLSYLGIGQRTASSTITQQLAKILLGNENERTLKNKIIEFFYTLSLEAYKSKEEILIMYANSVYFGNQVQGLEEASKLYFGISPDFLTEGQILQLLSTIHSPAENNPANFRNENAAISLAKNLNLDSLNLSITPLAIVKDSMRNYAHYDNSFFEAKYLIPDLDIDNQLTIDKELTKKIRGIVEQNIEDFKTKKAQNGAAIVIKLPDNEILAMVGSPNPFSLEHGYQINMLTRPRSIGSTIKPFLYLKAFEKGARPYTLVEDREYKYMTALGFPLYPKNFDYKYHGQTSLHYALSNSLNVPAVKVLEYLGLDYFTNFLEKDLEFKPVQNMANYQLGIALGGLEMSLLDLSKYFTIFPNNGILKPLKILKEGDSQSGKKIIDDGYVQLINKVLSDRKTGIDQFGFKSDLNLFQNNYALKTGTSKDYKDSWIVGYTPDFLVGVWVGNHDNSSMDEISGQIGAGKIWADIMNLLLNSNYNKETPFDFSKVREFYKNDGIEYGLAGDDYEKSLSALKESNLILDPHQGDNFLFEENSKIILKSSEDVKWFANEVFLGKGKQIVYIPQTPGSIKIKAFADSGDQEVVEIWINQ